MSTIPNGARLSPEALEARRQYAADWRERNRAHLRQYNREYAQAHPTAPEKRSEYNRAYWEKRAAAMREERPA